MFVKYVTNSQGHRQTYTPVDTNLVPMGHGAVDSHVDAARATVRLMRTSSPT